MTTTPFHEDLWEFPCKLNVKAMGLATHPMEQIVSEIASKHCSAIHPETLSVKPSRTGKYHSITLTVTLDNRAEAEALYQALGDREEIKWTL